MIKNVGDAFEWAGKNNQILTNRVMKSYYRYLEFSDKPDLNGKDRNKELA